MQEVETSPNGESWRSILSACQNCLTPLGDQIGSDPSNPQWGRTPEFSGDGVADR